MQDKIVQAGVGASIYLGDSGDGLRIEHTVTNDAQLAAALAHQDVAAGEKGHAEGPVERLGDDGDFDLVLLGRIEDEGAIA